MKKFDDYCFMSIGSNCAPILFLGPNRLRGPVDNIIIKDAYVLKFLVEGTYFSYIINKKNYTKEKPKYLCRQNDPKFWTIYPYLCILHNDPESIQYREELTKRLITFNSFLQQVKTNPNYYFTFCLNEWIVDTKTHLLKTKTLYYVCEYLKSINLLSKVIFVQLHSDDISHGGYCNCYIKDIYKWKEKYNLKVIDLYSKDKIDGEELYQQFKTKVLEVI